ncbi:hypothetical protein [Microbulbifer guangxiensis]|uniref:hypothetical protein n=1 Tax=Microbulbifer guangxiensis TaxID=2904249 RepID=UPI001F4585C4|nr:hypothetical protein [Microbulbifer guangxiensis]
MTDPRTVHVNVSESETRKMRRQLESEIQWLQRQMDDMQGASGELDVSLLQTYKEMIYCRRALLGRMPR